MSVLTVRCPLGVRPDLSIDGTIEIEQVANTLFVGRPVQGQPNSTMGLFRLVNGGAEAARLRVELGRTSEDREPAII